ncbi:succinate dehydrogenase, hydrophobic membrane anchor protein [Inhella crocodyli]|uniref:Succinate dehydrogenase hydrophobic membrane anchor subunit n=1 Tax=Inhella crocodyli TaxID=2499851 RepID=A0A3S2UK99_9BURK|nr:succinate dehydrogenase, hydrophobic membrane anchor protein [Inhella crocodyli]RVT88116.1 succinate dehydrogenase, hydrophobic membrane anchor protein [Inhella crocodyli]
MTTYGSKRLVSGAHYGLRDWLAQRVTGALMALFTIALLVQVLLPNQCAPGAAGCSWLLSLLPNWLIEWLPKDAMGYDRWAAIFSAQWMKVLTFTLILSLAYHAWVGVRDIWMDYVKPVSVRLVLHVFTLVWLVACTGWAVQVLWRL